MGNTFAKNSPENEPVDEELLLKQVTELVIEQKLLAGKASRENRVVQFLQPNELKGLLDLTLDGKPNNHAAIYELCKQAIDYSVHTNHPRFFNQLYHGADPVGLAGAWLSEALNTNAYTYEVAPFFVLVEHAVLEYLRKFIGWDEGDGLFSPGASLANMYGMVLARYAKFPDVKTKGMASFGQLVAFTSSEGHYSLKKGAHWLGIGTDNIICISTDDHGRMLPEELDKAISLAIQENKVPFFVNATAATTVLGAFDPLEPIAGVCQKHGLWLHVDAALGGGALVSRAHRSLLQGIDRADSVAWNPHKMLGAPLQCSAFLTKHKDLLHRCNSASAAYLFQTDKFYDVQYDTGDKSVQCGRKVDAFKLWLMWKARGDEGLEQLVDNAFDCTAYTVEQLSKHSNYRLVLKNPSFTNVCFWYIPPRLQNAEETADWWNEISRIAPIIKKRMVEKGTLMLGYQPLADKNWVNFFRLSITCQPPATRQDVDFVIEEIHNLGKDL